jgi:hypothetical protein
MKTAWLAAAATANVFAATAQTPPPPADAAFEVASIKLNRSGGSVAGLRRIPGGRFEATNIQLTSLISFAYQLQSFELDGGPAWLMGDRWDIVAKIAGDPPPAPPGTADAMAIATAKDCSHPLWTAWRSSVPPTRLRKVVRRHPIRTPWTVSSAAYESAWAVSSSEGGP